MCNAAVNKSRCAYCDYHVQSEFARMRSGRAYLQDSHLGGSLKPHLKRAGAFVPAPALALGDCAPSASTAVRGCRGLQCMTATAPRASASFNSLLAGRCPKQLRVC